ncbi:MAG: DUF58 domain-containing protein, partial [Gammaproteobacteria bacterium]|nr:DUF58 domain-containing protein [Gammaproteobacteria bacterium]
SGAVSRLERFARSVRSGAAILPRQIYILPTRYGLVYAALVAAVFLGAVNYGNNLAFLLAFQLGGLGLVAMLLTWRNLRGLRVDVGSGSPVFAGERARFMVSLLPTDGVARPAVQVDGGIGSPVGDVPATDALRLPLDAATQRRGRVALGRFRVSTRHPLGLLRAWCYVDTEATAVVYPRPAARYDAPPSPVYGGSEMGSLGVGADDFVGLRPYRIGDSPARMDWKTLARERGLHTRQFGGDRADRLWLSFEALAPLDTESRLSLLCRGVLDAERAGRHYGLQLPGGDIPPGNGAQHAERCLSALALLGEPP